MRTAMVCVCILFAALPLTGRAAGAQTNAAALPLEDVIRIPDQTLLLDQSVDLNLPPLPDKPGKIVVLRFRAVSYADAPSGCSTNASVKLNGSALGRFTLGREERMIGRSPMFEFTRDHEGSFAVFNGSQLEIMFAPDVKTGDAMTRDGLGATFSLAISDLAQGVDGNTLTLSNTRKRSPLGGRNDLIVQGIEIGWLDKQQMPKPPSAIPERGAVLASVTAGGLRLSQGKGGGFSVTGSEGVELMVETGLGMKAQTPSDLVVEDAAPKGTSAVVAVEPWGPAGYCVTATWPKVRLARTVAIEDGIVRWKERWTNTGNTILGVPFRHRLFLRGESARFVLSGDTDASMLAVAAKNPTVYLESGAHAGTGIGITAESDWLRLLMWVRTQGGVGEIYSETLALAPGSSIDFDLTIAPVLNGGYWSFINAVRRRWGVNNSGVKWPVFWKYAQAENAKTPDEAVQKALAHLGPIVVAHKPWVREDPDMSLVRSGSYPKLSANARPTPGKTPDLDADAFLRFEHHEDSWRQYKAEVDRIHRLCPQVKVIQLMHPAMEIVYKPLASRWPYASEAILDAAGKPFESPYYSSVHLYEAVAKDWGVLYYVPRPGSTYLAVLLRDVRRSMDACGSDGIYFDEFIWAGSRGYSRYDYSRWDGYSADLDSDGNVLRLKSDGAFVTESAQLQIVESVLTRGKFFLSNGAAALRSTNAQPVARFAEGGNGYGPMASVHLSTVPLVLGNFGDQKTRKGIFEAVKMCLGNGCVYSPLSCNLLLEGADNFVCKLYPITIRDLGAGVITAEQRLITTQSGAFDWPGRSASVRLYVYNPDGDLTSRNALLKTEAGKPLALTVPKDGLVIAEIAE